MALRSSSKRYGKVQYGLIRVSDERIHGGSLQPHDEGISRVVSRCRKTIGHGGCRGEGVRFWREKEDVPMDVDGSS